MLFDIIFSQFI